MDLLWTLAIAMLTSLLWGVSFIHLILICMACVAGVVWIAYHMLPGRT